jgi:hypothetical protein
MDGRTVHLEADDASSTPSATTTWLRISRSTGRLVRGAGQGDHQAETEAQLRLDFTRLSWVFHFTTPRFSRLRLRSLCTSSGGVGHGRWQGLRGCSRGTEEDSLSGRVNYVAARKAPVSHRRPTSANVSQRRPTSAIVSQRQPTSANVSLPLAVTLSVSFVSPPPVSSDAISMTLVSSGKVGRELRDP